jgi:hypothetical protein
VGVWMALLGFSSNPCYYDNTLSLLLVAVVLIGLPVKWAIRYEDPDFEPLLKVSPATRKWSRGGILVLLVYTALRPVASLQRLYDLLLGITLLLSWTFLTVCLCGPRVICSERFLAISRHPIFLFRRDLLRRYLKSKMRDAVEKDSNGAKL